MMHLCPITLPQANAFVSAHHRHHPPLPGGFAWFCIGALVDGVPCGVAIAGRPTNRNNDDGLTVEILRVATDSTPHVASMLLGACARAAKACGARRCITYTLTTEPGTSLRAAGYVLEKSGIRSWWTHAGSRTPALSRAHHGITKARWAVTFDGAGMMPWPRTSRHVSESLGPLFAPKDGAK